MTRTPATEGDYGWDPSEKRVLYNDNYYITFSIEPKTGYQFPLRATSLSGEGLYMANTATLRTNRVGSSDMNTADKFGYWASGGGIPAPCRRPAYAASSSPIRWSCCVSPTPCMWISLPSRPPSPVRATCATPARFPDDLTGWHPNDVMGVRVLTLSGETTQDGKPSPRQQQQCVQDLHASPWLRHPIRLWQTVEATNNGNSYEGFTVFRDEGKQSPAVKAGKCPL